jgi:hypothetical protein
MISTRKALDPMLLMVFQTRKKTLLVAYGADLYVFKLNRLFLRAYVINNLKINVFLFEYLEFTNHHLHSFYLELSLSTKCTFNTLLLQINKP